MADAVTVSLSLVKEVMIFLNQELDRYEKVKIDVERIETHLSEMRAFVQDGEEGCEEKQAMKALVDRIRKVAHDMEDVLDDYMIHAPRSLSTSSTFIQTTYEFGHHFKHWLPVHKIQSRIAGIQASMSSINTDPLFINTLADVNARQPPEAATSSQPCFVEDEFEIVGIDAVKADLEALISNQGDGCWTISVVGPSGAGKTVLVKTVFKSKRVMSQFHCHAWLSSPHSVDKDLCIQRLLAQFTGSSSTTLNLENYLGGKRFMLVIDGVRKLDEWVVIKQALASVCSSNSGSRIIITTQNNDIASRCNRVLRVEGLDWKTSWKLFCRKAFGNEIGDCPPHLLVLSQAIVARCENLPQPISVVGDHLSRRPQEQAEWKRVGDNIVVTMHGMNRMFLPSYSHLPTNQRSCLLYFGIFPEDCSVKRERLIRLWLSEGFVENEDQAVDTLNELISRNLVHSSSRDFKGRVKSCRVLDLMRQFVCQKSMENRFARVISEATGNQHLREESRLEHRRLSIENAFSCSNRIQGLKLHSVRSLFMMFGLHNGVASPSKIVQETLNKMKRLKVLDLENAPLSSFPESLGDFTPLLRYLSLRNTQVSVIPEDIKKLRYLEFLDLKQTQVSKLPGEIFSLKYLRHLLVYRFNPIKNDNFEKLQGVEIVGEIRMHPDYIRKLSLIRVQPSPRFFQTVKQLTRLKKLGLCGLKENDGPSLCECINVMPHLSTLDLTSSNREENLDLRSLYVKPPNRTEVETTLDVQILEHLYLKGRLRIFPEWFSSLNSLSKLILRGSRLTSINAFEVLQKLPNLIELEMNDAFTAEVLIVDTGGFPKLRTLHIEQFNSLTAMVAHNGSMPMVEKLTLVRCMRLHELPFGIDGLKCLEKLMLYDMPAQFITRLQSSEDHSLVSHIPVIHSFNVGEDNTWQFCNFSSRHTSRAVKEMNKEQRAWNVAEMNQKAATMSLHEMRTTKMKILIKVAFYVYWLGNDAMSPKMESRWALEV